MFFIVDKQKICTYIISILTVFILFEVALVEDRDNLIATSAIINKKEPIYTFRTGEKEIILTMNLMNLNREEIINVNKWLEKEKVPVTFFVSVNILKKYPKEIKDLMKSGNDCGILIDIDEYKEKLTYEQSIKKIRDGKEKLDDLLEKETKIYRTTLKKYNDIILTAGENQELFCIESKAKLNQNTEIKRGDIVLIEESEMLKNREKISENIRNMKKRGYKFKKISENSLKKY